MKLNVWQAEALAKAMREHANPAAPDNSPYYAEVELRHVENDDHRDLIVIWWEDGTRLVLGDNYANHFADVTDNYPHEESDTAYLADPELRTPGYVGGPGPTGVHPDTDRPA